MPKFCMSTFGNGRNNTKTACICLVIVSDFQHVLGNPPLFFCAVVNISWHKANVIESVYSRDSARLFAWRRGWDQLTHHQCRAMGRELWTRLGNSEAFHLQTWSPEYRAENTLQSDNPALYFTNVYIFMAKTTFNRWFLPSICVVIWIYIFHHDA